MLQVMIHWGASKQPRVYGKAETREEAERLRATAIHYKYKEAWIEEAKDGDEEGVEEAPRSADGVDGRSSRVTRQGV
jgi:hypothetical protein